MNLSNHFNNNAKPINKNLNNNHMRNYNSIIPNEYAITDISDSHFENLLKENYTQEETNKLFNEFYEKSINTFTHQYPLIINNSDSECLQNKYQWFVDYTNQINKTNEITDHQISINIPTNIVSYKNFFYKNYDIFEGYYKNGLKNGYGKYAFFSGELYEGNFKDGAISGFGKIIYKNGDEYVGFWKNNMKHGKGEFTWKKNGNICKGYWKNNNINGFSIMLYKNGSIVIGSWKNGKFRECNTSIMIFFLLFWIIFLLNKTHFDFVDV